MTNLEFKSFLEQALKKTTRYMWGDYGRPITEKTISMKAIQYPDHYTAEYQAELRQLIDRGIGCDCTGLIKWFLWSRGNIEHKITGADYNAITDHSASGWYNYAKVRGEDMAKMPETPGLIVWLPGHCGVYIGDGKVIECTKGQFGNGVVQTKLGDRDWKRWCECKYIDYTGTTSEVEKAKLPVIKVSRDLPTYSTMNLKEKIGTVYTEDDVLFVKKIGRVALIIYPTAATFKAAFIDADFIEGGV